MRVIKCDICSKELNDYDVYTTTDFIDYARGVELCEECLKMYNDFEHEFYKEKDKIYEKYQKDCNDLKEKYKKEILKLRENS